MLRLTAADYPDLPRRHERNQRRTCFDYYVEAVLKYSAQPGELRFKLEGLMRMSLMPQDRLHIHRNWLQRTAPLIAALVFFSALSLSAFHLSDSHPFHKDTTCHICKYYQSSQAQNVSYAPAFGFLCTTGTCSTSVFSYDSLQVVSPHDPRGPPSLMQA